MVAYGGILNHIWDASWRNKLKGRANTQISLGIHSVWTESSVSAWRNLGSLATHYAHREESDQTERIPRPIWVFAGRTRNFIGFVTMRLIYSHTIEVSIKPIAFIIASWSRQQNMTSLRSKYMNKALKNEDREEIYRHFIPIKLFESEGLVLF